MTRRRFLEGVLLGAVALSVGVPRVWLASAGPCRLGPPIRLLDERAVGRPAFWAG